MEAKTERAAIDRALTNTGLVNDRSHVRIYALYRQCEREGLVFRDQLRKEGTPLDRDELKALGLRANVRATREFVGLLLPAALLDPLESAHIIAATVMKAAVQFRYFSRAAKLGIPERVEFLASTMAAGPCADAAACDGRRFDVQSFPDLPFRTCDRLGQCGCMWQSADFR